MDASWDDTLSLALNGFPNASLGEDNDGQLIIYTNLFLVPGEKDRYEDRDE